LTLAALADVLIVVKHSDGSYTVLRDDRIDPWDRTTWEAVKAAAAAGASIEEAIAEGHRVYAVHRLIARNRPGGYWVFGNETVAARNVMKLAIDPNDIEAILICSDGFNRFADTFGQAKGPEGLLEASLTHPLDKIGDALRWLESLPWTLSTHPRFAPHDDATAIVLRRRRFNATPS
jgi:hypothetical protein